jgi:hypothetical protein
MREWFDFKVVSDNSSDDREVLSRWCKYIMTKMMERYKETRIEGRWACRTLGQHTGNLVIRRVQCSLCFFQSSKDIRSAS